MRSKLVDFILKIVITVSIITLIWFGMHLLIYGAYAIEDVIKSTL